MADRSLAISKGGQAQAGCIASVVHAASGERRPRQFFGATQTEQHRAVAAWCDSLGEGWKVAAISTPDTILRDLLNDGKQRKLVGESHRLMKIGRGDLIAHVLAVAGTGRARANSRDRRDA